MATPTDHLVLTATKGVNPDLNERPSPVTVTILELADRVLFDSLDFEAVWASAEAVLSDQLLSKSEMVLLPGQTASHHVPLKPRAAYVAVIAGYRNIDNGNWKVVYPVRGSWSSTHRLRLSSHSIWLERGTRQAKDQDE